MRKARTLLLTVALTVAATCATITTTAGAAHAGTVAPECTQANYDLHAPYFTYTDFPGNEWRCARNAAGRYIWFISTGYGQSDPPCDEFHYGVNKDHYWRNANGDYFKCEYLGYGRYGWVRLNYNPFTHTGPADAYEEHDCTCGSGVTGGPC